MNLEKAKVNLDGPYDQLIRESVDFPVLLTVESRYQDRYWATKTGP